jgi:hypothetical protein
LCVLKRIAYRSQDVRCLVLLTVCAGVCAALGNTLYIPDLSLVSTVQQHFAVKFPLRVKLRDY